MNAAYNWPAQTNKTVYMQVCMYETVYNFNGEFQTSFHAFEVMYFVSIKLYLYSQCSEKQKKIQNVLPFVYEPNFDSIKYRKYSLLRMTNFQIFEVIFIHPVY